MMKKAAAVVFAIMLSLCLLLGIIYAQCLSAPLMAKRMETFSSARLTQGEYAAIAAAVVDYLHGGNEPLTLFQAHEQLHMADVQGLVLLLRKVLIAMMGGMLILWLVIWRSRPYRIIKRTLLGSLLVIAGFILWGIVDFGGLFTLFHRISFTNNLWLLNPATDFLIQLMPTGFFMAYALSIGMIWIFLDITLAMLYARAERRNHGLH